MVDVEELEIPINELLIHFGSFTFRGELIFVFAAQVPVCAEFLALRGLRVARLTRGGYY